jgi:hypothetical protein
MASRPSKNTIELLAQFPTFRDWVVNNLTVAQLDVITNSKRGPVSGAGHPLNDQKFSAGLFRAYRSEIISQIRYEFASFGDFLSMRGQGAAFDETYHTSVVWAVVFMTMEHPEVYQEISDAGKAASDDDAS